MDIVNASRRRKYRDNRGRRRHTGHREEERLVGVEAVIDKDLASALTAVRIGADEFYILTDGPRCTSNFVSLTKRRWIPSRWPRRNVTSRRSSSRSAPCFRKVKAALYFVRNGGK